MMSVDVSFISVSFCKKDGESQEDEDNRQIKHCQKLAYIVEGKSISTRCPGNCACCKSGAKTKTSKYFFLKSNLHNNPHIS